jgi:hypothetical protein
MNESHDDDRGLLEALVGDGRPLLLFTGLSLALSGAFALFLSASGHFLPHDVAFLGMQPEQLCAINECRIVHFMVHDRVSFGGTLIAIGVLYMWLTEFPLRQRQPWSWWVLLVSGLFGFSSFLAYLGYGYLDTWHGVATLALLPCFAIGMARAYLTLPAHRGIRTLIEPGSRISWTSAFGLGRACLLMASAGLIAGGLTIMAVGVTCVFVPQDLDYIGLTAPEMAAINPRLVPLIAHDRAGFGGGVATCGLTLFFCVWCAAPSRSLWQVLSLAGFAGFATAIGIHPAIGYTDALHLAPAVLGAAAFALGLALCYPHSRKTAVCSTLPTSNVY